MMPHRLIRRRHALVVICLLGTNLSYVAAQSTTPRTSQLGGWVYVDRNNNGVLAFADEPNPELVIPDVTVSLFALNGQTESFVSSMLTDVYGRYQFSSLSPGTYTLKQTQPTAYVDGLDTLGSFTSLTSQPVPPSASIGTMSNNMFSNIVLPANVSGDFYNYGERGLTPGSTSKRLLLSSTPQMQFATKPEPDQVIPEPASAVLALTTLFGAWRLRRR